MPDDLVTAAMVSATDPEAQAIVERDLAAAGIACFLEGSVVYGVQVRSRDLTRAREILAASSELRNHWHQFPPVTDV
jgi:hypothetical protein